MLAPWKESYDKPRQHIKKQRHHFSDKGSYSQSYGSSSSHIWMWKLDQKEGWALKNSCFWAVVLESTLESPLDSEEIKPVNAKGNQSWKVIGRTDAKAETPALWPPDVKNWLIAKDPDAGKDWRQEEKGTTEDETLWTWVWAVSGRWWRMEKLACCSPRGGKESDTTVWLNNNSWLQHCVCFRCTAKWTHTHPSTSFYIPFSYRLLQSTE